MTSQFQKLPELIQTTDNFHPSPIFSYHSVKSERQYQLVLNRTVKAMINLAQDHLVTKQKVEPLLSDFIKQVNPMMKELLQETAQVRRKLRTQKEHYQSILREQKSKVRKLSEQNVNLSSQYKNIEQTQNKNELKMKKKLQKEQNQNQELKKQVKGLQTLLQEYQKELSKKDELIAETNKKINEKQSLYDEAKTQICNQTQEIQQFKIINKELAFTLRNQEMILTKEGQQQLHVIIQQDKIFQEEMMHKNKEISYLAASELQKKNKIDDLIALVTALKKELKIEKQQKVAVQNQAKENFARLKLNSDKAIETLKQKYECKIRKIAELLRKELKKVKKQSDQLKVLIAKSTNHMFQQAKSLVLTKLTHY